MNNKGQLTIFIIIGILILLVIVVAIYFYKPAAEAPLVFVEKEVQPIYDIVEACVKEISKEGLAKLGLQGGYIQIPPAIKRNPLSFLSISPDDFVVNPLWYYEGENRAPSLEFMQRELENYLKELVIDCVDGFSAAPEGYKVEIKDEFKSKVVFGEKDTTINVNWPLEIKFQELKKRQDEYRIKLPVRVKPVYELAKKVMDAENKELLFEKLTMNLLVQNPEIPFDGLEFSCGKKQWNLHSIQKSIQELLSFTLPIIRVHNTNYLPFLHQEDIDVYYSLHDARVKMLELLEKGKSSQDYTFEELPKPSYTPPDAFDFHQLTLEVGASKTNLQAGFYYLPEWGLRVSAQPNDGGMLKSSVFKGIKWIRFFCINQWHFAYDVIYPVMVLLRDPEAFDGEGYTFQFSLPVLINDNQGERVYYGLKQFKTVEYDTEFCNKPGNQALDIRVKGFEEGLAFAVDLEGVNVTLECGPQICPMGITSAEEGVYRLETVVPEGCANPFIRADKENYVSDQTIALSADKQVEIVLTKLRELDMSVVKYDYSKYTNQLSEEAKPLLPQEKAYVYITISKGLGYDQVLEYPAQHKTAKFAEDTLEYDVNIVLTDVFGNVLGGYAAEKLKIPYEDIEGRTGVVLKVLQYAPIAKTAEDQANMMGLIYSPEMQEKLKPEFT
ncbi:hypothetical protein HYV79_05260 [Candidatus Woesearchaeota archaeon]|nr:hypothetical protein [Candidatus Woesearchaeota archaeon]